MAWTGLNLTVDGRSALNRAQADRHLNFKSIVVGDGNPPGNFGTIKELVHQLFELTELKIDMTDDGCMLTADLPDVDYDYYMREIGVIVTTEDGEKLYVYDNCGSDAQYIVSTTGAEKTKKRVRLSLMVSDVESITVSHPSVLYVSYDDFDDAVAELKRGDDTVLEDAKTYTDGMYRQATAYADKKVADAIKENESVMDALDAAVGKKANQSELDTHVDNSTIHITSQEREKWNGSVSKTGDASNTTVTFTESTREKPKSEEKLSTIVGKIVKWLADLKTVAFSGSYNDLTNKPTSLPANGGTSDNTNFINIVAGNEIRFNKNNYSTGDLFLGYCWSDGSKSPLLNNYIFGNMSGGGLANIKANKFIGSVEWNNITGKPSCLEPYFSNNTWYNVGNDCAIGDYNVGGNLCVKGINGTPGITLYSSNNTKYADVIHSANIGSQSVNYANSAGSVAWGNVSGRPSSLPASDVYSWAKASSKPSYTASEVGALEKLSDRTKGIGFNIDNNSKLCIKIDSSLYELLWANNYSSYVLPLSGGTMKGNIYMNANKIFLYSTTQCIEANDQDVNIISAGKGSSAGYVNARVVSAFQVRNLDNSAWRPINAMSFNTQSSKRYKKNITNMSDEDARKLLKYRVVNYDYINEMDGIGCNGLIAEEVAEIDEYPIYRTADGTIEGLDYSKFVPKLIKMIQIQQQEIDELKKLVQR